MLTPQLDYFGKAKVCKYLCVVLTEIASGVI